jgi:V/A-type H+-transporting ATPase subunit E
MPLDRLIERILHDARERAERIVSEAQMRRMEMISEANRTAEERHTRQINTARRAAEEEKKQRVTMAVLDARKVILEEKQELIQEVFDRALKAFVELPEEKCIELLVDMLTAAAGEKNGELVLSPGDRERVGEEIVSRANCALEESGKHGRVTLSKTTRDIASGFILHMDGIEINNSLEAQINSKRLELEPQVVEILFGGSAKGSRF